ncbi:MAG: AbrB/MazE/SpoVT family DNA-binding domain-containing protein [Bacillota bacterium]|nr:AbrB/MazE/SpoVT family DNA-binding domain-containing protein [Bacillota bacterium]
MNNKITATLDENGQISLPLEANHFLNLQSYDYLKVEIKSDSIILIPLKAIDEESINQFIHEGILIQTI